VWRVGCHVVVWEKGRERRDEVRECVESRVPRCCLGGGSRLDFRATVLSRPVIVGNFLNPKRISKSTKNWKI
jgi:hypothetical protein